MEINIVGSGNVATRLAEAAVVAGHRVACVASRSGVHAARLATKVGASAEVDLSRLPCADMTIVAVSDDAICAVADELRRLPSPGVVAHTSGATDIDALRPLPRRAVLYPCQTFSEGDSVEMRRVPFLVEAADLRSFRMVEALARDIGGEVVEADGRQRATLHLAAVFGNNFANHLLLQAERLMAEARLPFSLLQPLMEKTVEKAFRVGPLVSQTGPARRGDMRTIARHETLLQNRLQNEIYGLLTKSIADTYRKAAQ